MGGSSEKGQILVETLFVLLCLITVFLVFAGFTKRQNEGMKKYEITRTIQKN